ncbi:MAG TPA: MFS transporter [Gemmataceae bacterium]|jgi:MFS family permease|nr:MFS transporter [Gemmataceae bacterium]
MSRRPRWLVPLCLASLLWAFSFGVNAPLASLWMQGAGCGDTLIGLNTGAYYLGIALAAGAVPWLMRRWGRRVLLLGMIASGVTAAAFPWGGGLFGWFMLRVLNGVAAAVSLIPLETYVNRNSAPERRAQAFGYYAFCVALGMALGTLAGLQTFPLAPRIAFLLGGAAALLGAVVVLTWRPAFPADAEEVRGPTPLEFGRNFLSFGSAWSQGFLEGGMVALLPIYLLSTGLSAGAVSWLMSGLMVGVILAQVPVAWLADRLGRLAVLAGCNAVALGGIACLLVPAGTAWLALWLFAVGACSGAFYPLGLALLGERLPPAGLARANAWFLAINCAGSLTGPVVAGAIMDLFGRGAMFLAGGGAVGLVLALWGLAALAGRARAGSGAALPDKAEGPQHRAA